MLAAGWARYTPRSASHAPLDLTARVSTTCIDARCGRRDLPRRLAAPVPASGVLWSEPLPGTVEHIERAVRRLGLEGVGTKLLGSRYRPGKRSEDWALDLVSIALRRAR
jgi:hypothetical protein